MSDTLDFETPDGFAGWKGLGAAVGGIVLTRFFGSRQIDLLTPGIGDYVLSLLFAASFALMIAGPLWFWICRPAGQRAREWSGRKSTVAMVLLLAVPVVIIVMSVVSIMFVPFVLPDPGIGAVSVTGGQSEFDAYEVQVEIQGMTDGDFLRREVFLRTPNGEWVPFLDDSLSDSTTMTARLDEAPSGEYTIVIREYEEIVTSLDADPTRGEVIAERTVDLDPGS